jgi:predicted Zn-dependent protease
VKEVRLETGMLAAEQTLSTYAVGGLLELSRLRLEVGCELSGRELRALIDLALTKPTALGDSHEKLRLYRAQLAWQAGEVEAAFTALKDAADQNPASPVPLLLGAEWQIARGELAAAAESLKLAEARASARPLAYDELLKRVRGLLAQARESGNALRPPAAP